MATFRSNGVRYRYLLSTFFCYVPLALALGVWAWQTGTLPGRLWPLGIGLGVGCWTLIEYLLHRFVLHLRPHAPAIQRSIERLHLGHHREPGDEAKVTVPVYGSMPIAVALLALFRLLTASWEVAALLMIGSIGGYLAYETVHFLIHCHATPGRWLRWQRRYHLFHHFKDQRGCFGVTTPLWDWVFGTAMARPDSAGQAGCGMGPWLGGVIEKVSGRKARHDARRTTTIGWYSRLRAGADRGRSLLRRPHGRVRG